MNNCVRAGEYLAEAIHGFASAAPLMLGREALDGAALVAHIERSHPQLPVLVVGFGSVGHFNLEVFYEGRSYRVAFPEISRKRTERCRYGRCAVTAYVARCDTLDVVARLEKGHRRLVEA